MSRPTSGNAPDRYARRPVRLQLANRVRGLALFNLAIDSKLRSCDLVKLLVRDLVHGERVAARAIVMQQKTQRGPRDPNPPGSNSTDRAAVASLCPGTSMSMRGNLHA